MENLLRVSTQAPLPQESIALVGHLKIFQVGSTLLALNLMK